MNFNLQEEFKIFNTPSDSKEHAAYQNICEYKITIDHLKPYSQFEEGYMDRICAAVRNAIRDTMYQYEIYIPYDWYRPYKTSNDGIDFCKIVYSFYINSKIAILQKPDILIEKVFACLAYNLHQELINID